MPNSFYNKKGFLKREPPNHRRRERQVQLIAKSLDLGCSCRQARIKLQTAAFAVTVFPSDGSGKPVMNGLPVKIALLPGLFRHQLDLLPIGKGGDTPNLVTAIEAAMFANWMDSFKEYPSERRQVSPAMKQSPAAVVSTTFPEPL